jgi:ABC-type oligopeptide transport system ATPase subunit
MLGTEKIEAIAESLKEVAILIKKISADKKVDIQDIAHLVAFLPKIDDIILSMKDLGKAVEEGKDIDVAEIVSLIQKIHSKLKEVEEA